MSGRGALLIAVALASTTAGCAIGNLHVYHDIRVPLGYSGTKLVAVATLDQRPEVRSGEQEADFVGIQRGGYGNPFVVRTASGHDLAWDVTTSACISLQARGFRVTPVPLDPADGPDAVVSKIAAAQGERAVLIALRQWRADTYTNTGLDYEITIKVLAPPSLAVVAEARLQGRDDLGGSFWNPPAHAKTAVREAFGVKLAWLLGHPAVAAALSGP